MHYDECVAPDVDISLHRGRFWARSTAWFLRHRQIFWEKHTHPFNDLCPGLPGWAGTRKVKPICILLKQETVSGSGISWAICKSATRSRQTTTPAPHRSVFYRPDALPAAQPTASKHWRQICNKAINQKYTRQMTRYSGYILQLRLLMSNFHTPKIIKTS